MAASRPLQKTKAVGFDWVGTALILAAWVLVAHKCVYGFGFNIAGSGLWVYWGCRNRNWSVAVTCGCYILIGLYGLLTWRTT